jgi:hypothetical protein
MSDTDKQERPASRVVLDEPLAEIARDLRAKVAQLEAALRKAQATAESYVASGPTNPELGAMFIEEHNKVAQLEADKRKYDQETRSIHADMLALSQQLGLHYDGVSSPAGWLHGNIMPAVAQLEAERDWLLERQAETDGAATTAWDRRVKQAQRERDEARAHIEKLEAALREHHEEESHLPDFGYPNCRVCGRALEVAHG